MFLRCLNCEWQQDDFWHYHFTKKDWNWFFTFQWRRRPFGYNPESILLEDIAEWIYPRKIKMDIMWARERGFDTDEIHSWWFLKEAFKRYFRVRRNMKWKTYEDFKKDYENGVAFCPRCGKDNEWRTD